MASTAIASYSWSFRILEILNYFLQKLSSGKYTDVDSSCASYVKLPFFQDLIYAMTYGKTIFVCHQGAEK